jgi:hypothetical protein
MYLDKIMWILAWPGMIALSYLLVNLAIKMLDAQIQKDPTGEDKNP